VASTHIEMPQRLAAICIAIFIDICGPMIVIVLMRASKAISKDLSEWVDKTFEFYPAINSK